MKQNISEKVKAMKNYTHIYVNESGELFAIDAPENVPNYPSANADMLSGGLAWGKYELA